jgi:hypothetical protein
MFVVTLLFIFQIKIHSHKYKYNLLLFVYKIVKGLGRVYVFLGIDIYIMREGILYKCE